MDIPVSYIILKLAEILKNHQREVVINKWQIERTIDNILESNCFSDEDVDNLLEDYSLEEEINVFLNDSIYFYDDEEDNIILYNEISNNDFEYLMNSDKEDYDINLIKKIDAFFDNNISVLEILGIDYNKEMFNRINILQNDIEEEYRNIANLEMNNEVINDDVIHKLKLLTIKRNMIYSYMKGRFSLHEYEDITLYSRYLSSFNNLCELPLKIRNDNLHNFIINDPFHRALFFIDDNREFNLRDKFRVNIFNDNEDMTKNIFYSRVLETLDKRKNTFDDEEITCDLINAKYRLMSSIDTIYGDFYLKKYKSRKEYFTADYSFIKKEIYYFVDELLLYTDFEMTDVSTLNDYYNTIKSVLVETYYDLTGDEEVIRRIKNNPNYGKEHFITYLFEDIINKSKRKIRRKEDE